MRTEIETSSTYLSVSLSEEDKSALKESKKIIDDICGIVDVYGTMILFDDSTDILLSDVLEALEKIDYFINSVDGKRVEIIPY